MTIKKTPVATAVSVAKKATKAEAESVSTNGLIDQSQFDDLFIPTQQPKDNADTREYFNFMGKDRLVRYIAPTWVNDKETKENKLIKFVIYNDETCPSAVFGTLADLEYLQKRYPISNKYFISDQICKNGRHRFCIYRMYILGLVDRVE